MPPLIKIAADLYDLNIRATKLAMAEQLQRAKGQLQTMGVDLDAHQEQLRREQRPRQYKKKVPDRVDVVVSDESAF